MAKRPKIVTICGSSSFIEMVAAVGWIIERNESAIVLNMHLLPWWYSGKDGPKDHLAEFEDCSMQMDALHMRKIDMADEIFVVDAQDKDGPYIGSSTTLEVAYAIKTGKKVRYFSKEDWIRKEVHGRMQTSIDKLEGKS